MNVECRKVDDEDWKWTFIIFPHDLNTIAQVYIIWSYRQGCLYAMMKCFYLKMWNKYCFWIAFDSDSEK